VDNDLNAKTPPTIPIIGTAPRVNADNIDEAITVIIAGIENALKKASNGIRVAVFKENISFCIKEALVDLIRMYIHNINMTNLTNQTIIQVYRGFCTNHLTITKTHVVPA
jgi:hypothetical protein